MGVVIILLKLLFLLFLGNLGLYVGYVHLAWRVKKLENQR